MTSQDSGTPTGPPTSLTLSSPLSEMEARLYYAGLPSVPRLVARTGTTPWEAPAGLLEGDYKTKELHVVGDHAIKDVWEDKLGPRLHDLLEMTKVQWTSLDVVRIKTSGETQAPIVLWIGVMPTTLSGEDGANVAFKCQGLLGEYNINDIDVEIRESIVTRSSSPKLLTPDFTFETTAMAGFRESLSPTLGIPICSESTSSNGTGGFFIREDGNTRLLLVTARHVVLPSHNFLFKHKTGQHHNILIFNDEAFQTYIKLIKAEIEECECNAKMQEGRIRRLKGRNDSEAEIQRPHSQQELEKAKKNLESLYTFYSEVSTQWATPESRRLGHITLSPPFSVGAGRLCERYTEDWALIEVDPSKINASNFGGNAIDLGTHISPLQFIKMMSSGNAHSFDYPDDRILRLQGTISDEDMYQPIMVIKRGVSTGVTIGRANNIRSFVRYSKFAYRKVSREWAILPFDSNSGSFSRGGDSGSVIVDGLGRIGGLLTAGARDPKAYEEDITYATPISSLLRRMEENGICNPHLV